MAIKKKSKKQTKSKKAASKTVKASKLAAKKELAKKRGIPKKNLPKTVSSKKAATKPKAVTKKISGRKSAGAREKQVRGKSENVSTVALTPAGMGARSGGQSGDLEGLSDVPGADSESVDELIEEGNAFEAEAVLGVEDALDPDQGEVHTHEVPEDDVPVEDEEQ